MMARWYAARSTVHWKRCAAGVSVLSFEPMTWIGLFCRRGARGTGFGALGRGCGGEAPCKRASSALVRTTRGRCALQANVYEHTADYVTIGAAIASQYKQVNLLSAMIPGGQR